MKRASVTVAVRVRACVSIKHKSWVSTPTARTSVDRVLSLQNPDGIPSQVQHFIRPGFIARTTYGKGYAM